MRRKLAHGGVRIEGGIAAPPTPGETLTGGGEYDVVIADPEKSRLADNGVVIRGRRQPPWLADTS
jgi:hypothetical protein